MRILDRLWNKPSLLEGYERTIAWIYANTVPGKGIAISNKQKRPYPEVTGYLIPSLLQFGHHELAEQYYRWLLQIQADAGYWFGSDGSPSFFDTGQVLRGLLSMRGYAEYSNERWIGFVDPGYVNRAIKWMAEQICEDGWVIVPNREVFQFRKGEYAPEQICLYALEPLLRACTLLDRQDLLPIVRKSISHYAVYGVTPTLSHYQSYIEEALIDLGYSGMAVAGWPKYSCNPGTYQGAIVAAKLGMPTHLEYRGLKGGDKGYFPNEEISWAAKFFLDALYWHMRTSFKPDKNHPSVVEAADPRYVALKDSIFLGDLKVLDAGAGTGRYASLLSQEMPGLEISCCDLSDEMVRMTIERGFHSKQGSLMNLPYHSGTFDVTYCIEALEHAINKPAAIAELCRVTDHGGRIVIIDKSEETIVKMQLAPWEKWPDSHEVYSELCRWCSKVTETRVDNIFRIWIGEKE